MVLVLPDPREQARQKGAQGLSEALLGFVKKKDEVQKDQKEKALELEKSNAFKDLIGKLDPELLQEIGGITDNEFLKSIANKELEGRRERKALEDLGLIPRSDKSDSSSVDQVVKADKGLVEPQEGEEPGEPDIQPEIDEGPGEVPGVNDKQKKIMESLSDEQLVALKATGGKGVRSAVDQIQKNREFEQKKTAFDRKSFESDRASAEKITVPFITKQNDKLEALREKESASKLMTDAIVQGDLDFWSKDNLARFLGPFGSALVTGKGKQLTNARKEFLLSNIQRAGSRPNMWIEQQIDTMLPRIGESRHAQMTVAETLKHNVDAERLSAEVTAELASKDIEKFGFEQRDLPQRVDKEVRVREKNLQNQLAYRLREIHEDEIGDNEMRNRSKRTVPNGTPLTPKMARVLMDDPDIGRDPEKMFKRAADLGYTRVNNDQIQRWSIGSAGIQ